MYYHLVFWMWTFLIFVSNVVVVIQSRGKCVCVCGGEGEGGIMVWRWTYLLDYTGRTYNSTRGIKMIEIKLLLEITGSVLGELKVALHACLCCSGSGQEIWQELWYWSLWAGLQTACGHSATLHWHLTQRRGTGLAQTTRLWHAAVDGLQPSHWCPLHAKASPAPDQCWQMWRGPAKKNFLRNWGGQFRFYSRRKHQLQRNRHARQ